MQAVNLNDVLAEKERRAQIQGVMRRQFDSPIVSITVNTPGSVKYSPESVSLLYAALAAFRIRVSEAGLPVCEERILHSSAGPAAIIAVAGDGQELKSVAVELEETLAYGRLVDIDVFSADGELFSRDKAGGERRKCLVCDRPAVECIRAQRHDGGAVLQEARKHLHKYFAARAALFSPEVYDVGALAIEAMLLEASCTPAPGLVDRCNCGAHRDMDFTTFMKSSSALSGTMFRFAAAGFEHSGPPEELLPVLRHIGRAGEEKMFKATGGVNTQKGLIFLLGVLTAAAAGVARRRAPGDAGAIAHYAAGICRGVVARELANLNGGAVSRRLTAGERIYISYGITGIRGELEAGLPTVRSEGLPRLQEALAAGLDLNDSLVHALMGLITRTQDTTIINRHSIYVLKEVQKRAQRIMAAGGMLTAEGREEIKKLDEYFIQRNISPGGSADLLAATYFLHAAAQAGLVAAAPAP